MLGTEIFNTPCACGCWLILGPLICLFVMLDAERRDLPGCLWAIVVFVFNILGLLIYLIVAGLNKPGR